MVESVIADGRICSKFTAESRLQVVVRIGSYGGHKGLVGFRYDPPLFLLFLQEIISGRPFLARRNARFRVGWQNKEQQQQLMPGLFVRSLRNTQISAIACWVRR